MHCLLHAYMVKESADELEVPVGPLPVDDAVSLLRHEQE